MWHPNTCLEPGTPGRCLSLCRFSTVSPQSAEPENRASDPLDETKLRSAPCKPLSYSLSNGTVAADASSDPLRACVSNCSGEQYFSAECSRDRLYYRSMNSSKCSRK